MALTDVDWIILVGLVMGPLAVVIVLAILRGYHMDLRVWRPNRWKDNDGDQ